MNPHLLAILSHSNFGLRFFDFTGDWSSSTIVMVDIFQVDMTIVSTFQDPGGCHQVIHFFPRLFRQEEILAASKKTGARFLYEATVCGSGGVVLVDRLRFLVWSQDFWGKAV